MHIIIPRENTKKITKRKFKKINREIKVVKLKNIHISQNW